MQRRKLTIGLPQPCDEPWEAMQPVAGGRHCASCAKTVVDLSSCTDAQLLDFFSRKSSAGACCRLRDDQLNRTMQDAPERSMARSFWQRAAAFLLATHMLVTQSIAQAARKAHHTTRPAGKAYKPAVRQLSGCISGMKSRYTQWTFGPIALQIGDTGIVHVTPDSNFSFNLPLPAGFHKGVIRWAAQEVHTGVILDDSLFVDVDHPHPVIELHWQEPLQIAPAVIKETRPYRSYGGAPVIQFEQARATRIKSPLLRRLFRSHSKRHQ